jgi:hypothetical protein
VVSVGRHIAVVNPHVGCFLCVELAFFSAVQMKLLTDANSIAVVSENFLHTQVADDDVRLLLDQAILV